MPLLFAVYLSCLYLAGTDSPAAYTAAASGPVFGFLTLGRAVYLLTRRRGTT